MTVIDYIVIILSVMAIGYSLKKLIVRFLQVYLYKRLMNSFIGAYAYLRNVFDKEMSADEILKECDLGTNCIKLSGLNAVVFENSKELRKYFLYVGEFIVRYSELLEQMYNYKYETDEYIVFMESLRELRAICLSKGEATNIA